MALVRINGRFKDEVFDDQSPKVNDKNLGRFLGCTTAEERARLYSITEEEARALGDNEQQSGPRFVAAVLSVERAKAELAKLKRRKTLDDVKRIESILGSYENVRGGVRQTVAKKAVGYRSAR